jgi:hypothetical protein
MFSFPNEVIASFISFFISIPPKVLKIVIYFQTLKKPQN